MPTLAIFQPYRGMNNFIIKLDTYKILRIYKTIRLYAQIKETLKRSNHIFRTFEQMATQLLDYDIKLNFHLKITSIYCIMLYVLVLSF